MDACSICSGTGSGLTIEEQRALMDRSWAKVDAEAAPAAAPKLPGSGAATAFPAAVRILPLGSDRSGALFWKLACCPVLAGMFAMYNCRVTNASSFYHDQRL